VIRTPTLTEFLLARIAEDETAARAAGHVDGPQTLTWRSAGARHHRFDNGRRESYQAVYCGGWDRILVARDDVRGGPVAAHIARHDPAHVLARCEADRRIVAWARLAGPLAMRPGPLGRDTLITDGRYRVLGEVLRFLALPYADHPDYDEEWRP